MARIVTIDLGGTKERVRQIGAYRRATVYRIVDPDSAFRYAYKIDKDTWGVAHSLRMLETYIDQRIK